MGLALLQAGQEDAGSLYTQCVTPPGPGFSTFPSAQPHSGGTCWPGQDWVLGACAARPCRGHSYRIALRRVCCGSGLQLAPESPPQRTPAKHRAQVTAANPWGSSKDFSGMASPRGHLQLLLPGTDVGDRAGGSASSCWKAVLSLEDKWHPAPCSVISLWGLQSKAGCARKGLQN